MAGVKELIDGFETYNNRTCVLISSYISCGFYCIWTSHHGSMTCINYGLIQPTHREDSCNILSPLNNISQLSSWQGHVYLISVFWNNVFQWCRARQTNNSKKKVTNWLIKDSWWETGSRKSEVESSDGCIGWFDLRAFWGWAAME